MSAQKMTAKQREKWAALMAADTARRNRIEGPKRVAVDFLLRAESISAKNWGKYAETLLVCEKEISAQLHRGEILKGCTQADFEAAWGNPMDMADIAAGGQRALAEARDYLFIMAQLFRAYAKAVRKDPRGTVGLETAKKALAATLADDRKRRNKASKKPGRRARARRSEWETVFRFIDANADRVGSVRGAAEAARAKYSMPESVDYIRNKYGQEKKNTIIRARNMTIN